MATAMMSANKYRIIFNCKCGSTRAYDYNKQYGKDVMFVRFVDGQKVTSYQDQKCSCGKKAKEAFVRAVLSEHVCDARCTHAKGQDCTCSCGGENHGKDYMGI